MKVHVEKLKINYKTLEEFKEFKEYGLQELSMLEDLEGNIIDNDSESPFYGIYYGDKLVARMSLYRTEGKFNRYFEPAVDFLEIWKLEVLPNYQNKGFGKALVDFAKSFNMPLKTNARMKSKGFWEKMGFVSGKYSTERDRSENPLFWFPDSMKETNFLS